MGTVNHDAIVVTGSKADTVKAAQSKANELGLPCSNLVHSKMNGYVSFLIAPDGSKEFWTDSDEGDVARATFVAWMRERWPRDFVRFVHIRYGEIEAERHDDGTEATIVASQPDSTSER